MQSKHKVSRAGTDREISGQAQKEHFDNLQASGEKKQAESSSRTAAVVTGAVLAAILAVSAYFVCRQFMAEPDGAKAGVYQHGELVKTLSLDEPGTYRIEDGDAYNTIEVSDEGIRVTEASCPDGICMNTVWKGSGSLPIVCLPNGLVITTLENQDGLDVITY